MFDLIDRAEDIARYFGITPAAAQVRLARGFGSLHADVAASWRLANPTTEAQIIEWYRTTDTYIWELSAYHMDRTFGYMAQADSIAGTIAAHGARRVLCLGDGIGDLTALCVQRGLLACYHDLADSRTADFALKRAGWRHVAMSGWLTSDFTPAIGSHWDSIVSLDFLEHVPNVEEWVRAIHGALNDGGTFCAQNAFNVGSGPQGAIPCHLAVNDRFESDWDPLLASVGFSQITSNWYRKL